MRLKLLRQMCAGVRRRCFLQRAAMARQREALRLQYRTVAMKRPSRCITLPSPHLSDDGSCYGQDAGSRGAAADHKEAS